MPQIFQVLRCYKCLVFQIHQTKKSNKFECKLCGEKQSIKRHYGVGTGKDCRLHVQRLNILRGEIDGLAEQNKIHSDDEIQAEDEDDKPAINKKSDKSKWSGYVEKEKSIESNPDETMYLDDIEVVLAVPPKKLSKFNRKKDIKTNLRKCNNDTDVDEYKNFYLSADSDVTDSTTFFNDTQIKSHIKFNSPLNKVNTKNNEVKCEPNNFELKLNTAQDCHKEVTVPAKKFISPIVSSNSKWVQFVDSEEANNEKYNDDDDDIDDNLENSPCNPQALFSLCDDYDLDEVLDI